MLFLSSENIGSSDEINGIVLGFEQLPKEHEGGFKSKIPPTRFSFTSTDFSNMRIDMNFTERITMQCGEAMAYSISDALESESQSKSSQDGKKSSC